MKQRTLYVFFVGTVFLFTLATKSLAGLVDWDARNRYLKAQAEAAKSSPQDAKVSTDLPRWMQVEPTVKTQDEQKFDVNKDGLFQPAETKVYLRTVYQDVQDGSGQNVTGKDVQNSEVLKEYDMNKDGMITKSEAEKMKKDSL